MLSVLFEIWLKYVLVVAAHSVTLDGELFHGFLLVGSEVPDSGKNKEK